MIVHNMIVRHREEELWPFFSQTVGAWVKCFESGARRIMICGPADDPHVEVLLPQTVWRTTIVRDDFSELLISHMCRNRSCQRFTFDVLPFYRQLPPRARESGYILLEKAPDDSR